MKDFKLLVAPLSFLIGIAALLPACADDDTSSGGNDINKEYIWTDAGGESSTLRQDVQMDDMETFVEYVVKTENLKLQIIKAFSDNWRGELFCCKMDGVSPAKAYTLMTELLEKQSLYETAARNLEVSGVLNNVTTRGLITSTVDWLRYLSGVAKEDENLIKDALEKTKMMGDGKAQQELFELLAPANLQKGCKTAQE